MDVVPLDDPVILVARSPYRSLIACLAASFLIVVFVLLAIANLASASKAAVPLSVESPTPAAVSYLPYLAKSFAAATATPTTSPTATSEPVPTQTPTSTPTALPVGQPDPYFPYNDYSVSISYASVGVAYGVSVGTEIANRGESGQIYVSVVWEGRSLTDSIVFSLGNGERGMLSASFSKLWNPGPAPEKFIWSTRPAQAGDAPVGGIELTRSTLTRLGFYPGAIDDIALVGSVAYILKPGSLCAVDVSVPSAPTAVGSCLKVGEVYPYPDTAYARWKLAVTNNYAYVTIGHYESDKSAENGLYIVDLRNGKSLVGQYVTGQSAKPVSVAVVGSYAYVVTQGTAPSGSLIIIDVSNPASPKEVGRFQHAGADGIAVNGGYAYLAGTQESLYIIDVTTPASPTQVASYYLGTVGKSGAFKASIVLSDTYAYVATGYGETVVLNVRSPSNPTVVTRWASEGNGMVLSAHYLYMAGSLYVYDVSNQAAPSKIGTYVGMRADGKSLAVGASYVYLVGEDGMHILDKVAIR